MITKEKYIEYLISTPINYTCTNLSEHLENVSHDAISDYLRKNKITPNENWKRVEKLIKNTRESFLIVDDSVQDKRYSKSIELVKRQYSGAVGGLVRGIGVVNLVHSNGKDYYPIDYRIYDNSIDGKTKNDHFSEMLINAVSAKQLLAKRVL